MFSELELSYFAAQKFHPTGKVLTLKMEVDVSVF
jgi:hypothetical protein